MSAFHRQRQLWHALCMPLGCMVGCYYIPPLPDVYVNTPPAIRWPTENPYPITIRQQGILTLSLRASDVDNDEIFCDWPDLDNFIYESSQTISGNLGEITACRVTIQDPEPLVDQHVEALVTDGDRDNLVVVRYLIEATP